MLTILIADDEPHVVDLIRLTLEDERITVISYRDIQQAWSRAGAA